MPPCHCTGPLEGKWGNEIDMEHTGSILSIDKCSLFLKLGGSFMNVHYSTSNCLELHKICSIVCIQRNIYYFIICLRSQQ